MGSTNTDRMVIFNSLKYDADRVRLWREASMKYPDNSIMRRKYESALSEFGVAVMRHRMMSAHLRAMFGWVRS